MSNNDFDITYIGHICYDEITPFGGATTVSPGSAVLCGAMVSQRIGARTAVITRMNPVDDEILSPLRQLGAAVFVTPCPVTAFARVLHSSENVDERRLSVTRDPGPFTVADIPTGLHSRIVHLAGISSHEFTLEFIRALKQRGYHLCLDMQSFVRVIGPGREIVFSDVPDKCEIVSLRDVVKLDVVEAELLCGTRDTAQAAKIIADWGAKEVMVTEKSGVTLAVGSEVLQQPFTNRSQAGRTGRGDTTIAAYLTSRKSHSPQESLRFAAALVSLKMERPGPFTGSLEDVERRMEGDAALAGSNQTSSSRGRQ